MVQKGSLIPPKANVKPNITTIHGKEMVDNYFWLRYKENPEVIDYLKAENAYTEQMLAHTTDLQSKLYHEMRNRIKESDTSAYFKIGTYYYYYRTEEGKQYRIHCRKKDSIDAEEQIVLDENELADGHSFFRLGMFEVSPDHQILAYSVDYAGAEVYRIFFKNLQTGKSYPDVLENTYYSAKWANDNKTFFYNTVDETKRPYKIIRHLLGATQSNDAVLYEERDPKYSLSIKKSKDDKYIFYVLESRLSTEVWFLSADDPQKSFTVINPREVELEYKVFHHKKYFYIVTNYKAENFRIMRAPVTNPTKSYWEEVIPYDSKVKIDTLDIFENYMAIYNRTNGLPGISVMNFESKELYSIDFPESAYTINYHGGQQNFEYKTTLLRFVYESLTTPMSTFDYNMENKTRELKKREPVLGGFDSSNYVSERIFATTSDNTHVFISLAYRKGVKKDGTNPLFLRGYGSYGFSGDPIFDSNIISLLDRGFIYAFAHIRGGGEMGRQWYEQGKFFHKKNTFTDFIACAETLIAKKKTAKDKLVIFGRSAGGLLIGAVINMRPELFKIAVTQVPFVDVVNTMLDASIPLTTVEYEEWGNPNEKEFFDYMYSYSPYDNVKAQNYPHLFITAGLNDPRVPYWEPTKLTAKLRAMKTDKNRLLLSVNMGAGHSGASGRFDYLKEIALYYTFVLDTLGIK